jgi:hypothetical protein
MMNNLSDLRWTNRRNITNDYLWQMQGPFRLIICAERAAEVMQLKVTERRINDLEILTHGKRQGWSGAGSGDGSFGKGRSFLRSWVRQGHELLFPSLTDLVPTVLEEPHLSPLNSRLDSAHVNLFAISTSSGMCERLPTSFILRLWNNYKFLVTIFFFCISVFVSCDRTPLF